MLLDLKFSIGTLGLAAGTLFSALYGMNLKNFIEESDMGFAAVSGLCFVFTAFVCAYGLMKLRKVQRVRMWGEGGIQDRYATGLGTHGLPPGVSRPNWKSDSLGPVWSSFPGEERLRRARSERAAAEKSATGVGGMTAFTNSAKRPPKRPTKLAEIKKVSRARAAAPNEQQSAVAGQGQEGAAALGSSR